MNAPARTAILRILGTIAAVISVLAYAGPVGAQALSGTVVDAAGRPLGQTEVLLLPGEITVRTSDAGRFVIPELYPRRYVLNVRRVGYRMHEEIITVAAEQPLRLRIVLTVSAPTLDTVRARVSQESCSNNSLAGFACRQQSGVAYYRDSATLAALRPRQAFDLARGMPGIRQVGGRGPDGLREFVPGVRPSRCLITMVNGRIDPNPRRWEAGEVIGLEYYDTWQKVPLSYRQIAYRDPGKQMCDIIIYWLRSAPRR